MCDKVCYSQKEAGGLVNSFHSRMKKNGSRKFHWMGKIPMRAYYCKECGAYHVTSLKHYTETDSR